MSEKHLESLQQGLSPAERLNLITEHAMCIGCGICRSVARRGRIAFEVVQNGTFRPIADPALTHEEMDRIMDICPGTRVDGLPEHEIHPDSQVDDVWGVWRGIYACWSAEPAVRHQAATGGVLTGLGLYLVESGEVDFLLHAGVPDEYPAFGMQHVSRNREQIIQGSGSRYGPTATVIDVAGILDRAEQAGETFAFVGTPCDVSALRNFARHDSRLDTHCRYMLAMVCGGFMEPHASRQVLRKFDLDYDDVESLRYRGYGCPGPTTVRTRSGRTVHMNYLDFWGDDESTWGLPPRCKVCPDGIGDAADIAASDTWDGGSPTRQGQEDDPGTNAVLVRTLRGESLMNRAIDAGYLVRGPDMTCDDMNRVQPHQRAKKQAVWARYEGLRESGRVFPVTRGLRLRRLHGHNTEAFNRREREGAVERVRNGKFSEDTPVACAGENR